MLVLSIGYSMILYLTFGALGVPIPVADPLQTILPGAAEVWGEAELIVKVKEPQAEERRRLRPGQTLFAYLHLAPDPEQARDLLASGATCIAYETVTGASGAWSITQWPMPSSSTQSACGSHSVR